MKLKTLVVAISCLAGFVSLPSAAQARPDGYSVGEYELQGSLNRVDAAASVVWIGGRPFKVTGRTKLYVGRGDDVKAVGRLSDVPRGGSVGYMLGENGTVEGLLFRPRESL